MRRLSLGLLTTLVSCAAPTTPDATTLDYAGTWHVTYTLDTPPPIGQQTQNSTLTLTRQAAGQYTGTEVFNVFGITCQASLTVTAAGGTYTCVMPAVGSKLDVAVTLDGRNHFSGRYTASYPGANIPGTIDFKRQSP